MTEDEFWDWWYEIGVTVWDSMEWDEEVWDEEEDW